MCAVRAVDADGLPQRPLLPGGVAAAEIPQDRARPRVAQLLRCARPLSRRSFSLGCVVTPTRRCVCRDQPRTAGPRFSDRPRLSVASALAGLHVLPVVGAGGWRAGAAAAAAEDALGAAREGGGNAPAEPAPPAPVRHDRLHTTALAGLRPRTDTTDGLSLWFRLCKPPLLGDYIELEA